MKKLLMLVMLVIAFAVPAGTGTAQATTVVRDIPFDATIDACGETITLSGTLIGIFTEQPLHEGGLVLTFHFQPQGISGTSSSGAAYHGTGLTRETTVVLPSGGFTDTFVNRFHVVGTAGAPTYAVKDTVHITVTPAGEITASVAESSVECV
jgi:hypothetical protein